MRVLQINTVYKNGGSTGRIVYDLANCIKGNGDESYVGFGYEYEKTEDDNTFKMESILKLKLSILKTRLFAKHGFYNKNGTKRLIKWINEIRPDLIHLHNLHNHYINIEILFNYIKKNNIPVVWTLHDCWPFTGWCAYFDYVECEKWKTGCHHCPNKHEYPYTWFFDRSKSNYKDKKRVFQGVKNLTIVTPSRWLSKLVAQSFLNEYPLKVINNGIDLHQFKPINSSFQNEYNIKNKYIILAVAMNSSKRKGFHYLIKLANELDNDFRIVIVGLTKKRIESLPNNIIGIERTNSVSELVKIYNSADVFVNPTLEDNFPTTNIEAIACGTPVVTFKTGGSPESIDSRTGLVIKKGDLIGLSKAIKKIAENNCNVDWESQCRRKAEMLYNKKDRYEEYIKLYYTIIKSSN